MLVKKQILFLYVNVYRALYYVLDKQSLQIILHKAFADVFYVISIPKGRAKAVVGGQFASFYQNEHKNKSEIKN